RPDVLERSARLRCPPNSAPVAEGDGHSGAIDGVFGLQPRVTLPDDQPSSGEKIDEVVRDALGTRVRPHSTGRGLVLARVAPYRHLPALVRNDHGEHRDVLDRLVRALGDLVAGELDILEIGLPVGPQFPDAVSELLRHIPGCRGGGRRLVGDDHHPIVAEIRDLEDVLVNFDGITYAKGASVLKQLVAWVGREPFMRGVHDYFVKHHHANTELPDLLTELEALSGRDLGNWSKLWLETAGVNTLRPVCEIDESGAYSSFVIAQTAIEQYPTLRPHRVAIGLYSRGVDGALTRVHRIETDVDGPLTQVPELVGIARPDLLLLNDDDLTYAKIRLDETSLSTALNGIGNITDSLARALVWGTLWDATRDGEFAASRFVDVVLRHIAAETQSTTLRTLIGQLLLAAASYVAPERRAATLERVADALWQLAVDAEPGSDRQFQFVRAFAQLASTSEQLDTVLALLEERAPLDGLDIDTDLGWELLISLAAGGRTTSEEIEAALAEDRTATGQQSAAHARAALPTAAAKTAAWDSVFSTADLPNAIVRATGLGLLRAHDLSLLVPFIDRYFDSLLEIWNSRSYAIAEEIIEGFYPSPLASEPLRAASQLWLDQHAEAPAALRRLVTEHLAGVNRALAAQAVDGKLADG
ncbi:MAG: ERAP1-like C-terminal domain-containing protein, partial [Actinobacteria bacterium]|nr:ERAP1-like C-terminal domain-containing protein [Actinomycetota bacterium]